MLLFSHLFAGLVIGITLYMYFRDLILIAACVLGSILPDLIDKPLGQIVLASTIGYGRIYAHTLLFFLVVLLTGIALWWYYRTFAGIAFSLGILSHQLLDVMWQEPVNWYYPLFGPFLRPAYIKNNYLVSIIDELAIPSEWIFLLAVVVIMIQILQFGGILPLKRLFIAITFVLTGILAVCGIVMLYCGGAGLFCFLTGWKDPRNNIIAGVVIICVSAVFVVISARIKRNDKLGLEKLTR